MRFALVVSGILVLSAVGLSADIYVPDDYASIQEAIDAASNDDTIIVRPGTYFENLTVGKPVTIISLDGPETTIIDGGANGNRVFVVPANTAGLVTLEGFTITNGLTPHAGAGLSIDSFCEAQIIGNVISGNRSTSGDGGAIYCAQNFPVVAGNVITDNSARNGGAIYLLQEGFGENPVIASNHIAGNTASDSGGGIFSDYSSPVITDNVFYDNTTVGGGGGIYQKGNNALPITIKNNVIINNRVTGHLVNGGGGVAIEGSHSITFTNNIIVFNSSDNASSGRGGAIFWYRPSSALISNCTLAYNSAGVFGGGISILADAPFSLSFKNSIIYYNSAISGSQLYVDGQCTVNASYSDSEGGNNEPFVVASTNATINWGAGMIDVDPVFADSAADDFHLTWNSPCRDSGDNSVVTELYDFEGDPRIAFGAVDMGADEYYYHLYHNGDVVPGSPIDLKIVGYPGAEVRLALNDTILDPPITTTHGDLYILWPTIWSGYLGKAPSTGVLTLSTTVPPGWTSGEHYYLQALVGQWGNPSTMFTNLEALSVK